MNVLDMLFEIEDNQKVIKECTKFLKNNSYICLLKKIKKEFEEEKINYKYKGKKLKELKEEIRSISDRISDVKMEVNDNEFLLYNKTGNNLKVIEVLQNKIQSGEKLLKELEKESFELLGKEEKLLAEKENLELKLLELKDNFYNCKEESSKKIKKAEQDRQNAETNILNLKMKIPEDILKKYTDIVYAKQTGVAKVQNGICSGCKIRVSVVTLDDIRRGARIVCCDNCGRILFYNES